MELHEIHPSTAAILYNLEHGIEQTYTRASGKTTALAIRAAMHLKRNRPVYFAAPCPWHFREYCERIGPLPGRVGEVRRMARDATRMVREKQFAPTCDHAVLLLDEPGILGVEDMIPHWRRSGIKVEAAGSGHSGY